MRFAKTGSGQTSGEVNTKRPVVFDLLAGCACEQRLSGPGVCAHEPEDLPKLRVRGGQQARAKVRLRCGVTAILQLDTALYLLGT